MVALTAALMTALAGNTLQLERLSAPDGVHAPVVRSGVQMYDLVVDSHDIPRYVEGPDGSYLLVPLRLTVTDLPDRPRRGGKAVIVGNLRPTRHSVVRRALRPALVEGWQVRLRSVDAGPVVRVGRLGASVREMQVVDPFGTVVVGRAARGTVYDHVLAIRADRTFDSNIPLAYDLVRSDPARPEKTLLPWR